MDVVMSDISNSLQLKLLQSLMLIWVYKVTQWQSINVRVYCNSLMPPVKSYQNFYLINKVQKTKCQRKHRQLTLLVGSMWCYHEINRKNMLPLSSLDDVLLSLDSFEELKRQITRENWKQKTKQNQTAWYWQHCKHGFYSYTWITPKAYIRLLEQMAPLGFLHWFCPRCLKI